MDTNSGHADGCTFGQTFTQNGVRLYRPCTCGAYPAATNSAVGVGALLAKDTAEPHILIRHANGTEQRSKIVADVIVTYDENWQILSVTSNADAESNSTVCMNSADPEAYRRAVALAQGH